MSLFFQAATNNSHVAEERVMNFTGDSSNNEEDKYVIVILNTIYAKLFCDCLDTVPLSVAQMPTSPQVHAKVTSEVLLRSRRTFQLVLLMLHDLVFPNSQ